MVRYGARLPWWLRSCAERDRGRFAHSSLATERDYSKLADGISHLPDYPFVVESLVSAARLLVLGTHNAKKRGELERLLTPFDLPLATLADFPNAIKVAETGQTFAENARLKATQQAVHLGYWVLGEDSGLAVDALDGAPGIYSARYSGPQATDEANNQKLLAELGDLPPERRAAHYVCQMAIADPQGIVQAEAFGQCQGQIRREPAGAAGFGYDPLFELSEYHRTFGELGPAAKAMLSHRARAMRELAAKIERLLRQPTSFLPGR